jgi:hypothetical protein
MKLHANFLRLIACFLSLNALLLHAADELPVKRVVLFTSGVGFYQREGEVTGDAAVPLSFRTEQINDLLKSLVLQDFGGGKISPVVFGSRDPIERTLKSFAIDITDNPPLGEVLNRMRGVEAEIAGPKEIRGIIVGVETQQQKVKEDTIKIQLLNLLTEQGLRSIPLEQAQQIRILDPILDQEFRSALKALATSHDTQRKPVILNFSGQGKRKVAVGYILEAPIWKTSYRLELTDQKGPFLQGWAIVENTTDDDWKSVGLTLVSGRPMSFIMDLYQSLYVPRPTVVPEIFASLRPPVYEGGVGIPDSEIAMQKEQRTPAARAESLGRSQRRANGVVPSAPAPAMAISENASLDLAAFRDSGVNAMATAGAVGELFQYAIDQPVTVPRQKSAMLPIVNGGVEAQKVSIYNEGVQRKFPLNGLKLKNTTGLHLMQGPITVFDGAVYAGDARIEDLQPNEERLISYALDMKVEVEPLLKNGTRQLTSIRIRKGVLVASQRLQQTKDYTIRNKAAEKRNVVVEHAFRPDWKLIEPPKPVERTPSVYRFQLAVEPAKSEKLSVNEEQITQESIGLIAADINALLVYSRNKVINPKVKAALEKVVEWRNTIGELERRSTLLAQQISEITEEQTRIRENMKTVSQSSEIYTRYVKKFDAQETQIEELREQLRKVRSDLESQRKQLEEYITGLELE